MNNNFDSIEFHRLQPFLPPASWNYCEDLLVHANVSIRISRSRHSKLGDYTYDRRNGKHGISVNNDLNKFSFLITLIHEVAHYYVSINYKRVKPHGTEWKNEFRELLTPLLNEEVFPIDILKVLSKHMKNPKASTHGDHQLLMTLRKYDNKVDDPNLRSLVDLPIGAKFHLNKRIFEKNTLRRTRFICQEIKSGRNYLISKSAFVIPVE